MSGKSPFFLRLARPYVRRKLRRQFSGVRMIGLEDLRTQSAAGPLVLACNHVAWWDPLLLVHLDSVLGCDGYCLMDSGNLTRLPFFRWVGALGIDRTNSRSAYRDLRSAQALLTGPGKVLALFPHGDQRPAHLPLEFRAGVATLAASAKVPVIPLAIRYDYVESPRPVVHLSAGPPVRFSTDEDGRESFLARLEAAVTAELSRIDGETTGVTQLSQSLLGRSGPLIEGDRLPRGTGVLRLLSSGGTR